jgi:hypothetical protein
MEEQQLELARLMEIPEEGETAQITAKLEDIEPISDTEENEEQVRGRKRRKSVSSDHEDDKSDDDDGALPAMSQVRHSGRARKAPRNHEGFEINI